MKLSLCALVVGMSVGCISLQAFHDPFFDSFFDDSMLVHDGFFADIQKQFSALDQQMKQARQRLEERRRASAAVLENLEQEIAPHTMMMKTEDTPDAYVIKVAVDPAVRREDIKVSMDEGKLHIIVPGAHTTDIMVTPKIFACQVRKVTDEKTGDVRAGEKREAVYEHIISQQVMSLPVRLDLSRDPTIVLNKGELVLSFPKSSSARTLQIHDGVGGEAKIEPAIVEKALADKEAK